MGSVIQDLRYGFRLLRREPAFTVIAVLTMALGIGAATTLFSVTYGVLLRPLPWPDSDRLVRITETRKGHEPRVRGTMSNGPYHTWADEHSTIEALGGWLNQNSTTISIDGGEPSTIVTAAVTPSLFTVLKARPLIGRSFLDEDVPRGPVTNRFVVLSYGFWRERFGGREDAIGRVVQIDGKPSTVVGVMPPSFMFPNRETRAWTPWQPANVHGPGNVLSMTIFSALARLRPGATPEQASAEGSARALSAPDPGMTAVALFGGNGPADIRAIPAVDLMTAEVRPALLVLLAAVALLLVSATANVASLQLARATTRRREIAIRAAIGAAASRLRGQLIAESGIIGIAGGIAGVALTVALHRVLPSLLPADFPRVDAVAVDWRVLLFALAASVVPSIVCGLLPAWQVGRVNLVESLSEAGRAPSGGGMRTGTARARTLIMMGQIAVSCVMLVGAALLVRSFSALLHADRGYDPANVLTARIAVPADYSMERRNAVFEGIAGRLRALPGVREAAYGNALPLLTSGGFRGFKMRSASDPAVEVEVNVMLRVVSPGYFRALGLRLVGGREFGATDTMTAPQVIVVNRSFASKYLGANPIGSSVPDLGMCRGNRDRWEVVGIVDDVRQGSVSDPRQPEVFLPARQIGCTNAINQAIIVLRSVGDPVPYAAAVRSAVHAEAPTLAADSIMTMEDRVMQALAKPRLYAVVLVAFGGFTAAIAAAGLFGVLSYSVAQRSREIGVRTALGAQPRDIVGLVVRQAVVVAGVGLLVGLGVAAAAVRSLSAFLYGVSAYYAFSFVLVSLVLMAVAVAACIVPARRAARVDPLEVLRAN